HPAHAALLGLQLRLPPASTLFPYTTLFRSLELLSTLNQWVKVRDASGDVLWVHRGDLAESRHVVASTLAAIRRTAQPNGELVVRSEEHTSELQSRENLVCRLLLEKKKKEKA